VKKIKSIMIAMLLITMMFNVFPMVFPAVSAHPDWKEEWDWLAADVNYDGKVNMKDIYFIILWFGEYCPDADVNCDTKVNMKDIYEAILHFGKHTNEITIVDSAGRTVTIPYPLERIVVLNPPGAEILRALEYEPGDRRDIVVGVSGSITRDCNYWPTLCHKTKCSEYAHGYPFIETIASLNTQVVFWYSPNHPAVAPIFADVEAELGAYGIKLVGLDCFIFDHLDEDMTTWGIVLGRRCKVKEINDWFDEMLGMVADRTSGIPENEKRKVYWEHHSGDWVTCGFVSEWDKAITMAGAKNIYHDMMSCGEVDPLDVCEKNPEVYFKDTRKRHVKMGYGETDVTAMQEYLDGLMASHGNPAQGGNPCWYDIDAVVNGQTYLCSQDLGSGPEKVFLVVYIAKICYPTLFEDVDPDDYLRDWIRDYQHLPCENIPIPCGYFMYPAI